MTVHVAHIAVDAEDRSQARDVVVASFAVPSGAPYARVSRSTGAGSCEAGVLDAEGNRVEIGA